MNDLVLKWADERGLLKAENAPRQMLKLIEEVGELAGAMAKNKPGDIVDAIGDIQVVLIILSKQLGYDYQQCLVDAYNVIKERKGKLINGVFVKD
jgi:NTP pyrophosphatase (non-canonical NTP hydrolase)